VEKHNKLCKNVWGENAEKCINLLNYAENTLNYVEISTVNKIYNKAFRMYRSKVKPKALQNLTHNLSS